MFVVHWLLAYNHYQKGRCQGKYLKEHVSISVLEGLIQKLEARQQVGTLCGLRTGSLLEQLGAAATPVMPQGPPQGDAPITPPPPVLPPRRQLARRGGLVPLPVLSTTTTTHHHPSLSFVEDSVTFETALPFCAPSRKHKREVAQEQERFAKRVVIDIDLDDEQPPLVIDLT